MGYILHVEYVKIDSVISVLMLCYTFCIVVESGSQGMPEEFQVFHSQQQEFESKLNELQTGTETMKKQQQNIIKQVSLNQ